MHLFSKRETMSEFVRLRVWREHKESDGSGSDVPALRPNHINVSSH